MKIFLGGTCAESTWRERLIKLLDLYGYKYFNPVVEDWTPDCQEEERRQKETECNVHLYVITKEMEGVFSIAEAVHSAHTHHVRCIFHIIPDGLTKGQLKSLEATSELISSIGGECHIGNDLSWIPRYIRWNLKLWEGQA